MSPTIQPTLGAVTWATDGVHRASASGVAAVVLGCDRSDTAAATSTYAGGVTTGCVAPTTVGATSTVGSPVHSVVGSCTTAIAGCSVTSEGAL